MWLLDYPGYGRSGGAGTVGEFDQFRASVVQRVQQSYRDGRTGRLVFVGHSFGGGVCAKMAGDAGLPSSLVLVSAFRDYESIVRARAGGVGWLVRPRIGADLPNHDIVDALEKYPGTVVVAATNGDTTVPFAASAALFRDLKGGGSSVTFIDLAGPGHAATLEAPETVARVREALSLD